MRTTLTLLALLCPFACTYNPPPEVNLGGPADRRYDVGDPIPIVFSEPVTAASLEIAVWPHEQNTYDVEGTRLAGVEPLLASCTVASRPCGAGHDVTLTLDEARTTASLSVGPGALGAPGRPLVLEVKGTLLDDEGRRVNVSRWLPFQIIEPLFPDTDTVDDHDVAPSDGAGTDGDTTPAPISVVEGPHLFYAQFQAPPVLLTQQFFADIQVDEASGQWLALMIDADAAAGSSSTTSDPKLLVLDPGPEGFMFSVTGTITRDPQGLIFSSQPFDLALTIGAITFALNGSVIKGRIRTDGDTGRSVWEGLMTVDNLYFNSGNQKKTYTEADGLTPANFQILELASDEIPAGLPRVCAADPCIPGIQTCNLVEGIAWPPATMCGE